MGSRWLEILSTMRNALENPLQKLTMVFGVLANGFTKVTTHEWNQTVLLSWKINDGYFKVPCDFLSIFL